ncbi:MAG: prevent-host-death family protein [Duncaniella sp.]|nr:prevent-host-death family protein [Bacteroides sp.]MDE6037574.1 prevent-host-death family protein [Duncaniella sp.]
MEIVTAREFRSNQGKFLTAARAGESVLLISRYGNFKITPIADEDEIVARDIRAAYAEAKSHINGDIELPLAKDLVF